ncbi:unnamed protein product [Sympodiomycopsis kandeliae]
MCCIFFTLNTAGHTLILSSNRDEFLARATNSAAWHNFSSNDGDDSHVLSGVDADPNGGGTWLGITKDGRWAALTNFTEVAPPPLPLREGLKGYRSRGVLVKGWLEMTAEQAEKTSVEEYAKRISEQRDEYPGFNILIGKLTSSQDNSQLAYVTNRNHTLVDQPQEVNRPQKDGMPGGMQILIPAQSPENSRKQNQMTSTSSLTTDLSIPEDPMITSASTSTSMGLSNSVLDEPWPKVKSGRAAFDSVLSQYEKSTTDDNPSAQQELITDLLNVMRTSSIQQVTKRTDIQCTVLVPPVSLPDKKDPGKQASYATRTSTILLVKPSLEGYQVTFVERDVHVLDAKSNQPKLLPLDNTDASRRFDFVVPLSKM